MPLNVKEFDKLGMDESKVAAYTKADHNADECLTWLVLAIRI